MRGSLSSSKIYILYDLKPDKLRKGFTIIYYTLRSSLQIQHSALLDDGTSHANFFTPAARGSIKTTHIPYFYYSLL